MAVGSGAPDAELTTLPIEGASPLDSLRQALRQHRSVLTEYCILALQPTLSDRDETRLGDILTQAVDDPTLSFWLDEADSWVGEQLDLLSEETFKQQQGKLRHVIGQTWVDNLWQDLQHRTKALQAYLKRVGAYSGAIDGVVGPSTQHAIESLIGQSQS
ncbi:MAG: peptidoglycan-binding domain-containing protein [Nodosilinea sp.]